MRFVRLAAAVVLLAVALPAAAPRPAAAIRIPDTGEKALTRAFELALAYEAQAYWNRLVADRGLQARYGANVCPGGVGITRTTGDLAQQLFPDTPSGYRVLAYAPVVQGNCTLTLDHDWLKYAVSPPNACLMFLHELGHSAMGLGHVDEPGIMSPYLNDTPAPGECWSPVATAFAPPQLFPKSRRHCMSLRMRDRRREATLDYNRAHPDNELPLGGEFSKALTAKEQRFIKRHRKEPQCHNVRTNADSHVLWDASDATVRGDSPAGEFTPAPPSPL